MNRLRYCLFLCVYFLPVKLVHANAIDSLSTKENVQKFLLTNFGKSGFISLYQYANISQSEKIKLYYSVPDTIRVEDPATGGYVAKTIPREYGSEKSLINDAQVPSNSSYDEVDSIIKNSTFRFYKADIDHNGLTDLVVNAGIVIIVVDLVGKFEGHLFSPVVDSARLSFKYLVSLPDSSIGLVFRIERSWQNTFDKKYNFSLDTIVYKFHGLLRYNGKFKSANISKIYYHYMRSYGNLRDGYDCIEMDKDDKCYLQYSGYDAAFSGVIDTKRITQLWNLIAYTGLDLIRGTYDIGMDHTDGIVLNVYLDDGSVKAIRFYGCHPSLGLTYVTKNISDISRQIKWQRSNRSYNFKCPCKYPEKEKPASCNCGM